MLKRARLVACSLLAVATATALAVSAPALAKPVRAAVAIPALTNPVPHSAPAPAHAQPVAAVARMLAQINAVRARNGLPRLAAANTLTRGATSYARVMLGEGRWAHAQSFQRGTGFSEVGEILGRIPGSSPDVAGIVRAWLASPAHRPILLGAQYRYVGIAFVRGRMGGRRTSLWVVRFGRR